MLSGPLARGNPLRPCQNALVEVVPSRVNEGEGISSCFSNGRGSSGEMMPTRMGLKSERTRRLVGGEQLGQNHVPGGAEKGGVYVSLSEAEDVV